MSSMDESSLLVIQIMISPSKTQDLFDDSLIALVLKIVKKKVIKIFLSLSKRLKVIHNSNLTHDSSMHYWSVLRCG